MLESIKFPSLLCFSFQIGDILLTCHMARLCSKGAIGADWLLVLKQVVIWSSGAIVGSHVLSITSFDQDYNFLKAMCIYIPIRRLNNISVDYMFHYKYVNSTFAYFLGGKGTPRRAQTSRNIYGVETSDLSHPFTTRPSPTVSDGSINVSRLQIAPSMLTLTPLHKKINQMFSCRRPAAQFSSLEATPDVSPPFCGFLAASWDSYPIYHVGSQK